MVDSSGWIEYFANAPNVAVFQPLLEQVSSLIVPTIVILEVTRYARRVSSASAAEAILGRMKLAHVVDLDSALAVQAAQIGLTERLALADSIILATARRHQAELWTQDDDFAHIAGVHYIAKPLH